MNFVLNLPFVGGMERRDVTSEVDTSDSAPLPVGAIAAVIVVVAAWVVLGVAVLTTLGELGPALTAIQVR